jgi:hypothetical protein
MCKMKMSFVAVPIAGVACAPQRAYSLPDNPLVVSDAAVPVETL